MAYSWIPFYEELANKLLEFKNDRPAMIAKRLKLIFLVLLDMYIEE